MYNNGDGLTVGKFTVTFKYVDEEDMNSYEEETTITLPTIEDGLKTKK